jgi:hypothetical protein
MFQVGRRHIKLPAVIAVFSLKSGGRGFPQQAGLVENVL